MVKKYYLDTCIWRGHYENRFGQRGRPLGDYATNLIIKIMRQRSHIMISDIIIYELKKEFNLDEIEQMFSILDHLKLLERTMSTKEDFLKAKEMSKEQDIPTPDTLHAIIAKKNDAILISQDKHFHKLRSFVEVKRPEEII